MMTNISLRYSLRFILLTGLNLLGTLSMVLCYLLVPLSAVYAESDRWYLDGQPVIEGIADKDREGYFGHKLTITNGSASGTESWSDGKCGGTYTGSMTWTPPPAFMQPGSTINFSMTAKTTVQNTCGSRSIGSGGWLKAEGTTIVKAIDESSPSASGTYTVPKGSPGSKLQMWVTVGVANQHGIVYYNYVYKGAGSSPTTVPQKAKTEDPPPGPLTGKLPKLTGENAEAFITRVTNNPIYVSADPTDLPPSQRKWIKIMPGEYETKDKVICVGKNWTVRTSSGSKAVITWKTTYSMILEEKAGLM